jgi:hypothetical protein
VLKRISELRREDVTGGWRKLHAEELHNLYCSPSIIRTIRWRRYAGNVARVGRRGMNAYVLVGKPERKRPLGRPKRRCENNIKMYLR